jgi:hypothetical protein
MIISDPQMSRKLLSDKGDLMIEVTVEKFGRVYAVIYGNKRRDAKILHEGENVVLFISLLLIFRKGDVLLEIVIVSLEYF